MIVTFIADDYGLDAATNHCIDLTASAGLVKSITVLSFKESNYTSSGLLKDKSISWGSHLYLTDYPFLTVKLSQAFENDKVISKRALLSALLYGTIKPSDIYDEFVAQISRVMQFGFDIKFIDTHQNIHGLPFIFPIVKSIAAKYNLGDNIRPFAQLDFNFKFSPKTFYSTIYSNIVGHKQHSRVLVNCPGYKENKLDFNYTLDSWDQFLSIALTKGYDEIVIPCHPGLSPAEVQLYTSSEFMRLITVHKVLIKR